MSAVPHIFHTCRFPVVGTSTSKYIYPRCWFLKAFGPQHTSLLWNIQFGDCKEIRLVNSFWKTHETQCRTKCKVCDTRYAWKCWWHEMSARPSPDELQPEWCEFNKSYERSHQARLDTYTIMRPSCYRRQKKHSGNLYHVACYFRIMWQCCIRSLSSSSCSCTANFGLEAVEMSTFSSSYENKHSLSSNWWQTSILRQTCLNPDHVQAVIKTCTGY